MMLPVERVLRPYRLHTQWHRLDRQRPQPEPAGTRKASADTPYPQPPYAADRFTSAAARTLASVYDAADSLKQAAGQPSAAESDQDAPPARTLAEHYNRLLAASESAGDWLRPEVQARIAELGADPAWENAGLLRQADGTLTPGALAGEEQAGREQLQAITARVQAAAGELLAPASAALLNESSASFRAVAGYAPAAGGAYRAHWPVPPVGRLLDTYI